MGDSGAEIYSKSGQSHHSIVTDIRQHCGYSNSHNLTEVGAHPRRWLELLTNWEHAHLQFALPKSGKPDAAPYFGSDCVVIVIDAHSGLQMGSNYTGLSFVLPSGKTTYREYCAFMEKLYHFTQVVYAYSDCSERFQMDSRC